MTLLNFHESFMTAQNTWEYLRKLQYTNKRQRMSQNFRKFFKPLSNHEDASEQLKYPECWVTSQTIFKQFRTLRSPWDASECLRTPQITQEHQRTLQTHRNLSVQLKTNENTLERLRTPENIREVKRTSQNIQVHFRTAENPQEGLRRLQKT